MRKIGTITALVLGVAALLLLPVASASADGSGLPPPAEGYAVPPPAYTAPPVYAAPVNPPPTVYVVPAPVYTAPWVAAPAPRHLYDYQYGYPPPTKWEQKGFCPPGQAKKGNC
jgi:hypothetical protein